MSSSLNFKPLQNDRILRAARGEKVDRPPVWIMRQAGRYLPQYHKVKGDSDFFGVCRNAEKASEITIQPIDEYDGLIDAAIIFSDILVIPQAMGMTVEMKEGVGPHFPNPLRDVKDLKPLIDRDVDVAKELDWAFKAITLTRERLQGRVPLLGFCGAPWTLMVYMIEGAGSRLYRFVKTWIYAHPEESKQLLQKITDVAIEFLALQVQAGAQMLQVFDSWASELGPDEFKQFSMPYLKQIAQKLPKRLEELGLEKVPLTVFAKGAWYALDNLCDLGYNTVGLDWLYDPSDAKKIANGRVTLQGNMDPGAIYGTKELITAKVEKMMTAFGKQQYIINLGHGTQPSFDPEQVRYFLQECVRVGGSKELE